MTLRLPPGLVPGPLAFVPGEALTGPRLTRYRFDLMDGEENLIGTLDSVDSGSVEWHIYASIKGGGSIAVTDLGKEVDWLNVRIRPTAILSRPGGSTAQETPCGVFLASAPVETWNSTGRKWAVELLDKCSILDQDIMTDGSGNPMTFVAPAGANVIATATSLIQGTGESTAAVQPDVKTLTSPLVWNVGTTRLKIINDLLAAAGYFSLWCDQAGQFQVTPYVEPKYRVPAYTALMPFSKGESSLMSVNWGRDRDIYSVPNRYVAVGQGDGTTEAMVAVATNVDPLSPFSFSSRGRWITQVITGVEAVSQADLNARAKGGLMSATSVTSGISVKHAFLPELRANCVVQFVNPDAGIDMLCAVTSTTIPFDPLALCSSELSEVTM